MIIDYDALMTEAAAAEARNHPPAPRPPTPPRDTDAAYAAAWTWIHSPLAPERARRAEIIARITGRTGRGRKRR